MRATVRSPGPWSIIAVTACVLLPLGPALAQDAAPTAGHDKGFFAQSADGAHKVVLGGRLQGRFTYAHDPEEISDSPEAGDMLFALKRGRVFLKGRAYGEDLTYKFQADFGKGDARLKDFYLDYALWKGSLHVRAGQYKRPFSRQQLTSSGRQTFVDRALTDEAFGAGRDLGLMLHNGSGEAAGLEWAAGVFNGHGENQVPDARFRPALVARLGYNHGGIKGYSEADLEGGPLRFALAASGKLDLDGATEADNGLRAEVDYIVKTGGLSSTGAFYAALPIDETASEGMGYHAQVGYMLGDGWQPALRYAAHMPEGDVGGRSEVSLGLSRYLRQHAFKWQTDLTYAASDMVDDAGQVITTSDVMLRTQVQLVF